MSVWALVSVAGVLAAAVVVSVVVRRWAVGGGRPQLPGVRVVGRLGLGPGHTLWVLELEDGRRLLVGAGRDGLRRLAWLPNGGDDAG
jgi:hypothetical protein